MSNAPLSELQHPGFWRRSARDVNVGDEIFVLDNKKRRRFVLRVLEVVELSGEVTTEVLQSGEEGIDASSNSAELTGDCGGPNAAEQTKRRGSRRRTSSAKK